VAATVNGALGYGFSSITVPVALLFYTNRILNPALVLVELVINGYVLFINRKSIPNIWWRVAPILIGLLIGVAIGSYILSLVHPSWVKFVTYFMLLPLILLQAAGIRKPIRAEKAIAIPFGVGIGTLYSVTTISGPPLALLFNNQGYVKQDFRAALGVIRVGEAVMTGIATILLDSTVTPVWRSFSISSPAFCWEFRSGAFSFVGWTLKRSGGSAWPSMP
jgi:Sulfite exporter TauE/SafE.